MHVAEKGGLQRVLVEGAASVWAGSCRSPLLAEEPGLRGLDGARVNGGDVIAELHLLILFDLVAGQVRKGRELIRQVHLLLRLTYCLMLLLGCWVLVMLINSFIIGD